MTAIYKDNIYITIGFLALIKVISSALLVIGNMNRSSTRLPATTKIGRSMLNPKLT